MMEAARAETVLQRSPSDISQSHVCCPYYFSLSLGPPLANMYRIAAVTEQGHARKRQDGAFRSTWNPRRPALQALSKSWAESRSG